MQVQTISISPMNLEVGDKVRYYGATLQVQVIKKYQSGESEVAACYSILVGEDTGAIPRAWFDTPESMVASGAKWAKDLPPGLYMNVQGNHLASVQKIIEA